MPTNRKELTNKKRETKNEKQETRDEMKHGQSGLQECKREIDINWPTLLKVANIKEIIGKGRIENIWSMSGWITIKSFSWIFSGFSRSFVGVKWFLLTSFELIGRHELCVGKDCKLQNWKEQSLSNCTGPYLISKTKQEKADNHWMVLTWTKKKKKISKILWNQNIISMRKWKKKKETN